MSQTHDDKDSVDPLERALGEILKAEEGKGEPTSKGELIAQEEIAALLGEKVKSDQGPAEAEVLTHEEAAALLDEAYARGRCLARVGDCALMVSEDRMKAFFRGQMPEGTTYAEVIRLLAGAGIRVGLIPNRIHEVLPRKRLRKREGRSRSSTGIGRPEIVVAEGLPPVPPPQARVEYLFREVPEEEVREFKKTLEGGDSVALKRGSWSLPLVRSGQVLARIAAAAGKPGRTVFGEAIPPPPPSGATLSPGENAVVAEDGQSCVAALCGYAGRLDGQLVVLSPLWISPDLLRGYYVHLPPDEDFSAPSVEEIQALLAREGVRHGILAEEIARLCAQLRENPREVERLTLIARGTDAVPSRDAEWKFLCDPGLTQYFGQIARLMQRSRNLEQLREYSQGLAGKAVASGEVLAIKQPPLPGRLGRDVFGEEFEPEEPQEAELEAGAGICLAEDGMSCSAAHYGYLGINRQGNRIELISPLWVARDRMMACFVNLPQLGEQRTPTPAEIDQLLTLAGVQYGVDHRSIGVLCERLKQGLPVDLITPLAQGRPPQSGEDGRFEFAVERERKPGFIRPDGSIDFKELNLAPLVAQGALIGSRIPAVRGTPGMDVLGHPLPAQDGREVVVDPGRNVRLVRQSGKPDQYFAEIEGELVVVERQHRNMPLIHLEVHEVMAIDGDVDYHTGNIDYPGSVHIKGSIRPGFSVKAEGNVIVGDSVEEGAIVIAQGNVAIRNGIAGRQTRVTAGGSVFAKYISEAQVYARADLNISEYIFRAAVQADGQLAVWGTTGRRTSGVIAGGSAIAGQRLVAIEIGTDASAPTRLVAGVDGELLRQLAARKQQIDQYRTAIGKVLRALEVERMPQAQIRQILLNLVLKAKGERRKVLAQAVRNLLALQKRLEQAIKDRKELEQQLEELAKRATIEVRGRIAPSTLVRIGGHTLTIDEESAQVTHLRLALGKTRDGKLQVKMTAG